MKIPETSANVGAYYGNEENGQWQPNGVIIDSGVPGGIVGSGDGLHPQPVYPVHIPRGHIPGYVLAGPGGVGPGGVGAGYYAGYGAPPDDFADYMWMENEEEFDKQVMQQLEEEALMEQCIEAMLEDEQRELERHNGHNTQHYATTSNGNPSLSLEETVSRSKLNPLAAEFVPTFTRPRPEEKKVAEVKSTEETQKEPSKDTEETPQVTEEVKTEDPVPPVDPPEVSAADVAPIDKKRDAKKDAKTKPDAKKPVKADPKKAKPVAVKSETKVQPKKKEVKAVKSEPRLEERQKEDAPVIVAELPKTAPPAVEPAPAPVSAVKPVNYAAAARATRHKPPAPLAPLAPAAPVTPAPAVTPAPVLKDKKPNPQRKNTK